MERGKYPKHKKKTVDVYYSRYILTMQGGGDILIKEFWTRCLRNMSPAKLSEAVKNTIPKEVRYVHFDDLGFEEYHRTIEPKEAPDNKIVLMEWTRFPKHYKKGTGIALTYLLICPDEYIEWTQRALLLAGFEASDCPF